MSHEHVYTTTYEMLGEQQLIVMTCACGAQIVRVPAPDRPRWGKH